MAWVERLQNASSSRLEGFLPSKPDFIHKMPSPRTISGFALSAIGTAQQVLGSLSSPVSRRADLGDSKTCSGGQLSCQNTTAQQDLCCFNSPGGALLQTQFWDTNPQTGPVDSWTIHGLWPDNCDGTYEANCDDNRAYTNITAILNSYGKQDLVSYMNTYWPDYKSQNEQFWEHEWSKHGTCVSTLDPDCYTSYQPTEEVPDFFQRTVDLFKTLPSYTWLADAGISPSSSHTYTLAQIENALAKQHGGFKPYVGCASGALDELWYFYNVRGSVQKGTFEPSQSLTRSNCPSSGIKYLPKSSGGGSPTSTMTAPGSSPTSSPGGTFSGSGYLNVVSGGSQNGCIISAGTWYTSGTCATITATASGDGFTLKSSKGNCGVVSGEFTCGSGVTSTVFTGEGNTLEYSGSTAFSTDSTPSGSTQAKVYPGSSKATKFTIAWQSR
ncbi:Ribonuclease T2-like [Fulvia fulva]|uniref:Ribonuclease T2-like n=1 Tax=Passalora fulva TaxID=5499 RepID=A0A9Q8PKC4_PASFU|nr:Ribonuclease T2-like [Fulvia fulva]KAK4611702.1 Ribonuclease T2-like [Fulvia fulva]UJO24007.1 Ribonuclease T2-like [Fulvia fulva]WPV21541.1 Ribonuclease T2-like [Fulvia fulva]WPV36574.1 Ribonuclease T2-like [Fulvia fulva]